MRKHAVNYWYGVEDEIAHYMGVGDGDELPELPYGVEVPAALEQQAREYYAEELRQSVPDPSGFMNGVKLAVMNDVAKKLNKWLRRRNLDHLVDQLSTNLIWLGDSFAHEELFGFIGGDPEYNFFLGPQWEELVGDLRSVLKEAGKNPDLVNPEELERQLMDVAQNAGDGGLQQEIEYAYERAKQGLAEFVQDAYEEPLAEITELFEAYLNEAPDPRALTAEDLVLWFLEDATFSFDYDDFVTAMGGDEGAEAKLLALAKEVITRPDPRQTSLRFEASTRRRAVSSYRLQRLKTCANCGHHVSNHRYTPSETGDTHQGPGACSVPGCTCEAFRRLEPGERVRRPQRSSVSVEGTARHAAIADPHMLDAIWTDVDAEVEHVLDSKYYERLSPRPGTSLNVGALGTASYDGVKHYLSVIKEITPDALRDVPVADLEERPYYRLVFSLYQQACYTVESYLNEHTDHAEYGTYRVHEARTGGTSTQIYFTLAS